MSNQPAPARPWFRLASIARPAAPTPTPTPEPPPPQPRPALARPAFRPVAPPQPVPTQSRETTPPPPAAATVPKLVPSPPPEPVPPVSSVKSVPTSPVVRAAGGVASVPTSPAPRAPAVPKSEVLPLTTSSLPPSPTPKSAPTSSVPTSPAPKPAPSASVPTSPATKPVTTISSVPTAPAPQPVIVTSSVPTAPAPKPVIVTSSVPTSPATKAVITSATRVPSPGPSLRTIKPAVQTPPQSPKPKTTAPPPSHIFVTKSHADLESMNPLVVEQKTVLLQKTIDKPKVARDSQRDFADSLSSGIARLAKQETVKDFQTKEKGNHKKNSSDSEDAGMRVITIAGENKGAFMEVIRSPKKHVFEGTSHILHKKSNPINEGSDSSNSEEGTIKKKDKNHKGRSKEPSPLSAFMNSNVQGVNNSIVYNSSCSHHDPGVHVALSRKPAAAAAFHVKDRGNDY